MVARMKDAYEDFFKKTSISKKQFFDFGLKEIIYARSDREVEKEWNDLKRRIVSNEQVFIRGFGRDAAGTKSYLLLYEKLFNNTNIEKDSTNNNAPTQLITRMTGYSKAKNSKYKPIRNFQVSHVFGRTKNVYMFTAPWNIVYIPKIVDPFTGHEAKGSMVKEFTQLFQKQTYKKFSRYIDEFNKIITKRSFVSNLNDSVYEVIDELDLKGKPASVFQKSIKDEFSKIIIP
jgi:hypothetical protein